MLAFSLQVEEVPAPLFCGVRRPVQPAQVVRDVRGGGSGREIRHEHQVSKQRGLRMKFFFFVCFFEANTNRIESQCTCKLWLFSVPSFRVHFFGGRGEETPFLFWCGGHIHLVYSTMHVHVSVRVRMTRLAPTEACPNRRPGGPIPVPSTEIHAHSIGLCRVLVRARPLLFLQRAALKIQQAQSQKKHIRKYERLLSGARFRKTFHGSCTTGVEETRNPLWMASLPPTTSTYTLGGQTGGNSHSLQRAKTRDACVCHTASPKKERSFSHGICHWRIHGMARKGRKTNARKRRRRRAWHIVRRSFSGCDIKGGNGREKEEEETKRKMRK